MTTLMHCFCSYFRAGQSLLVFQVLLSLSLFCGGECARRSRPKRDCNVLAPESVGKIEAVLATHVCSWRARRRGAMRQASIPEPTGSAGCRPGPAPAQSSSVSSEKSVKRLALYGSRLRKEVSLTRTALESETLDVLAMVRFSNMKATWRKSYTLVLNQNQLGKSRLPTNERKGHEMLSAQSSTGWKNFCHQPLA